MSFCHKIQYLGLQIGNNKICPIDEKVRTLSSIPVPKSKKLLRSFLGSVNFYRNFIPNLAERSSCLADKLKKNSPDCLEWTERETKAFEDIKSTFSNSPSLHIPDTAKTFVVRTDASSIGMGAVLLQHEDGVAHPVSFASKKLLPREQRYSTIEHECLSVYCIEIVIFLLLSLYLYVICM